MDQDQGLVELESGMRASEWEEQGLALQELARMG
jgi:hypothetical protein